MRSVVLILLPIALLLAAFYVFVIRSRPATPVTNIAQVDGTPTTRKVVPTTLPDLNSAASVIGQSGNVWVQTLNRKDRTKVANEFRAERFDPRPEGGFDVTFPEARFYGQDGGIVTLEGSGGKVSLSQPGSRNDPQAMGASTPTDGDLRDVIIRFYDKSLEDEPSLVAQVPAVHFDAIGNRISTVDSLIEGKGVMAEMVPITVRGRDFEFDGYGLTMSWNDRGGRLESLEVNRGERLLIKNVAKFNLPKTSRASDAFEKPLAASQVFLPTPTNLLTGIVVQATTTPASKKQLYHATFDKEVRVIRDDKQLAAAELMRVILPLGDAKPVKADAAPAEETRAQRARRRAAASAPAGRREPVEDDLGVRKPATKPSTKPADSAPSASPAATQPEGSPIEVRWTGKLTVRPVERIADAPRGVEQMVELVGSPAWVEEEGSRAEARTIRAEPDAGRVRLEPGGPVKTLVLHDANGAELRTRSPVVVDRGTGVASVNGGGTLITPANPPSQPEPTTVTWSRRLGLGMTPGEHGHLKLVTIEGEAKVASEQLNATSDTLALEFGDPTKAIALVESADAPSPTVAMPMPDLASLSRVVATGDASAPATMSAGKDAASRRSVSAGKIELGFVPLESGPGLHTVKCTDAVKLGNAGGTSVACANLDATIKPTAIDRPASGSAGDSSSDPLADLETFVATGNVAMTQADGSTADGERIELSAVGENRRITLSGTPARVATARGGLEGDRILFNPRTSDVNVPGPGRFTGTGDEKQAGSTMAVAWLESMNAAGATGTCDLVGGVRIDGTSATGTRLKASSQRGRVNFTPRAFTASKATTKPADAIASPDASIDAIRSVLLSGDVDVAVEAANVRTSSLQTQEVDIDLENGTVTAPQAGRLLVINGGAGTTQPSTQPAVADATSPAPPRSGKMGPGSLAVAWKNQLLWKMREGQLTFDGGVRMGFEKANSDDPIRLTCESVVVGLAPVQTGKGVDQMAQRIDLRSMTAENGVSVRSKLASFDSAMLAFDAVTNRATATGSPDTPVQVFSADGTSRVGFSAVTWNVENGMLEDFRDIDGRVRR